MSTQDPSRTDPRTAGGWSPIYAPSSLHDVIPPAMCDEAVRIATATGFEPSLVNQGEATGGNLPEYRVSASVFIAPDAFPELYREISDALREMNDQLYRFSIWGMDPIQIIKYDTGSFFAEHADLSRGDRAHRKISLIVQLSDPADYEGGDLEFGNQVDLEVPREKGYGCVFPSWCSHAVAPVTRGTRYSLAAWAKGRLFA